MAKKTVAEKINLLEARRDSLEAKLEEQEQYKTLEGQGSEGARTDFTDPLKLNSMLNTVNDKLADLYNQQRYQG